MADIDYTQLRDAIADGFKQATTATARDDRQAANARANAEQLKAQEDNIKNLLELSKTMREAGIRTSAFKRVLLNQQTAYEDAAETLKKFDEAISKETKEYERAELIRARDRARSAVAWTNFYGALSNASLGLIKFGDQAINVAASGVGQYVRGLQRGASAIEVSTGLANTGVELARQGLTTTAQGIAGAGEAMSNARNKYVRGTGIALQAIGSVTGNLTNKISDVTKFGIEVLGAELEKTIDAYNKSNSAGALFAQGMTGMRNAAYDAGLSVAQFANVLTKHSADLSAAGMGVTQGAERMGGALRAGGDRMRLQLLNLGYSIEEQAGLVAETMAQMRQSGDKLMASDAEVAQQTVKYAENLRVISAITGEDARKKSDAVKEQSRQLAFQQKLAGMEEGQRTGIINAMKNMSDIERRNFMDMVNFGTVINREGAAAAAMSPGLVNAVNGYYDAFRAGTLDEISARRISAQNTEQQKKDVLALTDIGLAGAAGIGGFAGQLAQILGAELAYRNQWTQDAIKSAEELASKQKETNDKLTTEVGNTVITVAKLQQTLEKDLLGDTGALKMFASAIQQMNKIILEEIQKFTGRSPGESLLDKTKRVGAAALTGAQVGGLAGSVVGTGIGAAGGLGIASMATAPAGAAIGGAIGAIGGALVGAIKEAFWGEPGKARGGISRGPHSGYIEKLHGIEAVVPLPDGRTIPVTVQMTNAMLKDSIDERTGIPAAMIVPRELTDLYEKLASITTVSARNVVAAGLTAQELKTTFVNDLESLSRFVDDSNKNFIQNLLESRNYFTDSMKTFSDTLTVRQIAAESLNRDAIAVAQAKYDSSVPMTQTLVTDLKRNLDFDLNELRAPEPNTSTAKIEKSEELSKSETSAEGMSMMVNQLKLSNNDLKETLLSQNKLIEQSVKTMQELFSVASETRNFSQAIAQNTL